jgi:hypothetical protein
MDAGLLLCSTKMVDILKKDLRHFKGYVSKLERELLIREPKFDMEHLKKSGDKKKRPMRSKSLSSKKDDALKGSVGGASDERTTSASDEMSFFGSNEVLGM